MNMIACTQHQNGPSLCRVIYSQFYKPGSLRSALDHYGPFSLSEKMKIALNLIKGLTSLHKKNIVHRDIAPDNCLIHIEKGELDHRHITAVICDLGRARYSWKPFRADLRVQGHAAYTPPEAIFRSKMNRDDYYATDIYAMGCIFYQIFYEKPAPWKDAALILDATVPEMIRYNDLVNQINFYTNPRRIILNDQKTAGTLSKQDAFEYLILRMVNPDPKIRGTARQIRDELKNLVSQNEEPDTQNIPIVNKPIA